MPRTFHVYVLASVTRRLYVGVTDDLAFRLEQHRNGTGSRFAARYNIRRLVRAEPYATAREAIAREKQIKGWSRAKKIALIESENPQWLDLTEYALGDRLLR
jgi:putative endonuclease